MKDRGPDQPITGRGLWRPWVLMTPTAARGYIPENMTQEGVMRRRLLRIAEIVGTVTFWVMATFVVATMLVDQLTPYW